MNSFGAVGRRVSLGCPARRRLLSVGRVNEWKRGIATTRDAVDKSVVEKLPLAGIKVLDMTRVLAGVCRWEVVRVVCRVVLMRSSLIARRFLGILGKSIWAGDVVNGKLMKGVVRTLSRLNIRQEEMIRGVGDRRMRRILMAWSARFRGRARIISLYVYQNIEL